MRYVFGPTVVNGAVTNGILARTSSGGTTAWYLTDKLGSVRDIVSSSGSELDHIVYDSFGNIVTETNAANGDRFKFAGMQYDSTTGQYYDHARSYSPALGRFSAQDPAAFMSGDNNLYQYANDEPVGDVDPSGLTAMGGPSQLAPIALAWGSMVAGVGLVLTAEGATAAQAVGGIIVTIPAMAEGVAMAATAAAATATAAATAAVSVTMVAVVAAEAVYAEYLAEQAVYWVGTWGMAVMAGWQLDAEIQQARIAMFVAAERAHMAAVNAVGVALAKTYDELVQEIQDAVNGRNATKARLTAKPTLPIELDTAAWDAEIDAIEAQVAEWTEYIDELLRELHQHPDYPGPKSDPQPD